MGAVLVVVIGCAVGVRSLDSFGEDTSGINAVADPAWTQDIGWVVDVGIELHSSSISLQESCRIATGTGGVELGWPYRRAQSLGHRLHGDLALLNLVQASGIAVDIFLSRNRGGHDHGQNTRQDGNNHHHFHQGETIVIF